MIIRLLSNTIAYQEWVNDNKQYVSTASTCSIRAQMMFLIKLLSNILYYLLNFIININYILYYLLNVNEGINFNPVRALQKTIAAPRSFQKCVHVA